MKKYVNRLKFLIFSGTAKDTFTLFFGNTLSAFLGFLFTLVVARALSVKDFGIFSAATNLVVILISLTDLGISSGSISFVSSNIAKKKYKLANKYILASTIIRFGVTAFVSLLVISLSGFIAPKFLAGGSPSTAVWVGLVAVSFALPMLFPFLLQAKRKFIASIVADNTLYLVRLTVAFVFAYFGMLTINNSLFSFVIGAIAGTLIGLIFLKPKFLKSKPSVGVYKKLFSFSGWLGVNRIISSISGRLDIQMLAIFAGAVSTGLYSIPSRLAGFVIVLSSSFSGVLAPRLSGFNNKELEKKYIIKALLAIIPITFALVLWILIAKPFIILLFGIKYSPSVPIFQALVASMIPFIFTAPSVTAIIYSIKKPIYIGVFAFFQIVAIFVLNYVFIPIYGPIGPAITFAITNTILLIYSWIIVIKYYWFNKS